MCSRVGIVLATYDGAAHVVEQVRSVQAQEFPDWRLFVRDDGSSDGTPDLLAKLAAEDARITVLESRGRLGVVANFAALLAHARGSGAEYVLPCDQDDVWLPTKLSRFLDLVARLEGEHGRGTPVLVHSDLAVVDGALRPLYPSFLRRQRIHHEEGDPLNVLLVQNFVTGCASLLNGALVDLALPFPEPCIMHDWWIAQCAAARGVMGFVPEATVLYRQHGANQVGATGPLGNLNVLAADGRRRFARSWKVGIQSVQQAGALLERLRERGGARGQIADLVEAYARIAGEPALRRVATLRRHRIRRQSLLRTVMLYGQAALLGVGGVA